MTELVPFLLGHGAWCAARAAALGPLAQHIDVLAAENLPFFHLVNAGNALAYGGAAMPAWVQLDCACLPAGMVGFAVRREALAEELWRRLVHQVEVSFGPDARDAALAWTGLVPLSEYTCVPTPHAGEVVGFSLYSLRRGLGLRTKALGLFACGAVRQTGIAQVDNASLRTHTALGPLEVVAPRVAAHSQPGTTFVYRLHVDDAPRLRALASGTPPGPRRRGTVAISVGPSTTRDMADLMRIGGPHAITDVDNGMMWLIPWS